MSKILDTWGRAEGFAVMVAVCTIGNVLMAICNTIQLYAAAHVRYASVFITGPKTLSDAEY